MNFKKISLVILIVSIVLFAIISLLSIWEIIEDDDFIWKSLGSLFVVGFSGLAGVALAERISKNIK